MPYTILAVNGIMDVMLPMIVGAPASAGRAVTLVGAGSRRHSWIAAVDVAAFAVAVVDHPEAMNRRIPIGGPEALSWRDIVTIYGRVLRRDIDVRSVAAGTPLPDLPPVPGLTELVSGLMAMLETFDSPLDMDGTARTFGVRMTSVADFVRAHHLQHA